MESVVLAAIDGLFLVQASSTGIWCILYGCWCGLPMQTITQDNATQDKTTQRRRLGCCILHETQRNMRATMLVALLYDVVFRSS